MNVYKKIGLGIAGLGLLTSIGCNDVNQEMEQYLSNKRYNGVSNNLVLTEAEMKDLKREFRMCHYNAGMAEYHGEDVKDGPVWDPYPHK